MRHPARAVRPARKRFRRGLHRLPGDEPGRREADRGRCRGRRRAGAAQAEVRSAADGDTVTIGFRPESLEVTTDTAGALPIKVELVEELGSDAYVYGKLGTSVEESAEGSSRNVVARVDPRTPPRMGDTLHLRIRPDELHVFSGTSGQRLS